MKTVDRTRIKICGIRSAEAAEAAIDAGADMVGVVRVAGSPRHVEVAEARALIDAVGGRVETVALFKDCEPAVVREEARAIGVDAVQWYGPVSAAELAPLAVIKPIAFDPAGIVASIRLWAAAPGDGVGHVRAVLIDTPSALGGGSGETFDWAALRAALDEAQPTLPIILAGGLTPHNVAEAVRAVQPWAVDVSSGVERERGVKDTGLIRAFCEAVRGC